MKCKTCINYDVCSKHSANCDRGSDYCKMYKDRSKFIELPCKIGDTVYVLGNCENIIMNHDNDYFLGTGAIECPFENDCDFEECYDTNFRIFKTRIIEIYCNANNCWFIELENLSNLYCEITQFGKTIFHTNEEAEAALEKLNEEREKEWQKKNTLNEKHL